MGPTQTGEKKKKQKKTHDPSRKKQDLKNALNQRGFWVGPGLKKYSASTNSSTGWELPYTGNKRESGGGRKSLEFSPLQKHMVVASA